MRPPPTTTRWPLALFLLAACSGASSDELSDELDTDGEIDGGSAAVDGSAGDGSSGLDAGAGPDAGDALDAGQVESSADAGDGLDAGMDAGAALDAGPSDAGLLSDGGGSDQLVTELDFEDALPGFIEPGSGQLTPSQDFAALGSPGNTFGATFLRSPSPNVVTVTLSDLPPHTSISLAFLFAAIDSLDGEGAFPAGDYFRIDLDGATVFRETFANALETQVQTYDPPAEVVLARRVDLGFGGPGGFFTDSAYDMGLDPAFRDLPHEASSAVFTFALEGSGVQDLSDESWAIDNLRVTVGHTPRERPDGGAGDAAVGR